MIWRRTIPKDGATRTVTKRAWLPKRMRFGDEVIWIWLDEYVDNELCRHSVKGTWEWKRTRRMVLSDALLEKLNPPPVAPPVTQSQMPSSQWSVLAQPILQTMWSQYQQQQLAGMLGQQQQGGSTP